MSDFIPSYQGPYTNPHFQGYFKEMLHTFSSKIPATLMTVTAPIAIATILERCEIYPVKEWLGREISPVVDNGMLGLAALGVGIAAAKAWGHKNLIDIPQLPLCATVYRHLGQAAPNQYAMHDVEGLEGVKLPSFLAGEVEVHNDVNGVKGLTATKLKVNVKDQLEFLGKNAKTCNKDELVGAVLAAYKENMQRACRLSTFSSKKRILKQIASDQARLELLKQKLQEGFEITRFSFEDGFEGDFELTQQALNGYKPNSTTNFYADGAQGDEKIIFKPNHACGFVSGGSANGPGLAQEEILFMEFAEPYLISTIFSDTENRDFILPQDNTSLKDGQPTKPTVVMYAMTKTHSFTGGYGTAAGYKQKRLKLEPVAEGDRADKVIGVTISAPNFELYPSKQYTEENLKFILGGMRQYIEGAKYLGDKLGKEAKDLLIQMGALGCGVFKGSEKMMIAAEHIASVQGGVTPTFCGYRDGLVNEVKDELEKADSAIGHLFGKQTKRQYRPR